MAIGDAFKIEDINAEEWSEFSRACLLPLKVVATELEKICVRTREVLPKVMEAALAEGANPDAARRVQDVVSRQAETLEGMAKAIAPAKPRRVARHLPPAAS
jgi:hypothetical protein